MAPSTSKETLDKDLDVGGIESRGTQLGEMAVEFSRFPPGNYSPLFEGLPHGCEAAHYGYVLAGRGRILYDDGTHEDIGAGSAYHVRPGHRFEVLETIEVVEFTPADGVYERTMKTLERNLPAFLEALEARQA